MRVGFWRNHLLLLAVLVLVAKLGHFHRWGGFQEKSTSKKNMNSTLEFFIENYNNVSNDTYLFRVDKLLQSHMQGCFPPKASVITLSFYGHSRKCKPSYLVWPLHLDKEAESFRSFSPHQLTSGVEYLVTVKISRTKCKRNSTKSHSCPIQGKKNLKKSFICNFLMYTVPWMNYYQLWNNSCLEA